LRKLEKYISDREMMHAVAGATTVTGIDRDFDFSDLVVDFFTAFAGSIVSGLLSPVATAMAMAGMAFKTTVLFCQEPAVDRLKDSTVHQYYIRA